MSDFHSFIRPESGWETVESRTAFANDYLAVREVRVRTPGRAEPRSWTVVHRKGAIVILPITAAGEILLVRQERVPIQQAIWELPAGQIDEATGHDAALLEATARRELREETGYEPAPEADFTSLGHFFPSAGFTDEHSHLFVVRPVVPSPAGAALDANEVITECRAFPFEVWKAMIASGEICDANTLAAFARVVALGLF